MKNFTLYGPKITVDKHLQKYVDFRKLNVEVAYQILKV